MGVDVMDRNKPSIEIMAHVYYRMLMYLEIELLLTIDIFGSDNVQFAKILQESLSLVNRMRMIWNDKW